MTTRTIPRPTRPRTRLDRHLLRIARDPDRRVRTVTPEAARRVEDALARAEASLVLLLMLRAELELGRWG